MLEELLATHDDIAKAETAAKRERPRDRRERR
jgi:hypothetical protein